MQTGTEERSRQVVLEAMIAEDTLRNPSAETASDEEPVLPSSAFLGMRLAVPVALLLWVLLAAFVWASRA